MEPGGSTEELSRAAERWGRWLSPALCARVARLALDEGLHGYDRFGLSRAGILRALALTAPLYERWFRVRSTGVEHLPSRGGAVLAANHSGTIPFDAVMIWADVLRRSEPPRVSRPVEDSFVGQLPFVGTLFARGGAIGGTRANVEAMLEAGELLLVFPEGVPGISKPFRERYRLQPWRVGHAEFAIRHGVPVVPVAVIGAEEQMPQLVRLPLHVFGVPHVPVPATLVPLPVRYHIHYGAPLPLHERFAPGDADDPAALRTAADEVRRAVEGLIAEGLRRRAGVFR